MLSSQSSLYDRFFSILPTLRKPRNFFFYILPVSIIIGRFVPVSFASVLNDAGIAMVQLIAFPAIPLVLSAVMISIANIFSVNQRSAEDRLRFSSRFFIALSLTILLSALLAVLLSIYQAPGILSPSGKLSIGRYMLDITDINVGTSALESSATHQFWISKLVPSNLLGDASSGQTLRVITGSVLAGLAMSRLSPNLTQPLVSLLRSINTISVQVLNIVLNLAPLVLICLIAAAVSTINAEIVVALLNFTICVFLTAIASLGISRLIFRRFTSTRERDSLNSNPVDSVFLLSLSTGSSMTSYPLMFDTLKNMGRDLSEVEASASLSLLIARLGNVTYNVIAIIFALNLYEVALTPLRLLQVVILGSVSGISAAGLTGVATVPTIGVALAFFQVPIPPVLVLLSAIDPILSLPRAATTGVLAMAISVISSSESRSSSESSTEQLSSGVLNQGSGVPQHRAGVDIGKGRATARHHTGGRHLIALLDQACDLTLDIVGPVAQVMKSGFALGHGVAVDIGLLTRGLNQFDLHIAGLCERNLHRDRAGATPVGALLKQIRGVLHKKERANAHLEPRVHRRVEVIDHPRALHCMSARKLFHLSLAFYCL